MGKTDTISKENKGKPIEYIIKSNIYLTQKLNLTFVSDVDPSRLD